MSSPAVGIHMFHRRRVPGGLPGWTSRRVAEDRIRVAADCVLVMATGVGFKLLNIHF